MTFRWAKPKLCSRGRVSFERLTNSAQTRTFPMWIDNLLDASAGSWTAGNFCLKWRAYGPAFITAPPFHYNVLPLVLFLWKTTVLSQNFWYYSTLGKSDYRDTLLNSEEFQFVSTGFVNSEPQIPLYSSPLTRASQPDVEASVSIVFGTGKDK